MLWNSENQLRGLITYNRYSFVSVAPEQSGSGRDKLVVVSNLANYLFASTFTLGVFVQASYNLFGSQFHREAHVFRCASEFQNFKSDVLQTCGVAAPHRRTIRELFVEFIFPVHWLRSPFLD